MGSAVAAVCCCRCAWLTLNHQWHSRTGNVRYRSVPGMTEPPHRYDVTIIVDQDGGHHPNPAEFAVAAQQTASTRSAATVSAHTASQIVSLVRVLATDRPAAVVVALAVVSERYAQGNWPVLNFG